MFGLQLEETASVCSFLSRVIRANATAARHYPRRHHVTPRTNITSIQPPPHTIDFKQFLTFLHPPYPNNHTCTSQACPQSILTAITGKAKRPKRKDSDPSQIIDRSPREEMFRSRSWANQGHIIQGKRERVTGRVLGEECQGWRAYGQGLEREG